jgi:hypothetical protein
MQTKSAERANKAMKGEQVEDVTAWIYKWDIAFNKSRSAYLA